MMSIKTDRDFIVHEQPNGDLWVYRRGGMPNFVKAKTAAAKPATAKSTSAKKPAAK